HSDQVAVARRGFAMTPLVSIVMPVYNGARFIGTGIEGVLRQKMTDWELIIVDDGSTDETPNIVASFVGDRIRYIRQDNAGPVSARNSGIDQATGRYVIFLDCDDWWAPDGLDALVRAAEAAGGDVIMHANWAYVDAAGHAGMERSSAFSRGPGLRTLLLLNPFPIHAVLTPRRILVETGGFAREMPTLEDWELWRGLAERGIRFEHLPTLMAYYFWHTSSRSKNVAKRKQERIATLDRYWLRQTDSSEFLPLKGPSYATAHIDFCVSRLSGGDVAGAWQEFDEALRWMPGSAIDVDCYYRIIHSNQAASEHSKSDQLEALDGSQARAHIESLIEHVCGSPADSFPGVDRRAVRATAYVALGLAHYNHGESRSALRYWTVAAKVFPRICLRAGFLYGYLRASLPPWLLSLARKAKHASRIGHS
ncbi:MAG: glycosyltransferase family A protein, partial [Thermoflexales bacterium]